MRLTKSGMMFFFHSWNCYPKHMECLIKRACAVITITRSNVCKSMLLPLFWSRFATQALFLYVWIIIKTHRFLLFRILNDQFCICKYFSVVVFDSYAIFNWFQITFNRTRSDFAIIFYSLNCNSLPIDQLLKTIALIKFNWYWFDFYF